MSPPGVPKGMIQRPSESAKQGLGVRRGRLPGARQDGWPRTARDWAPREDTAKPVPGTTGVSQLVSEGVEQSALPSSSMTQTIEVSGGGPSGASLAATGETYGSWPGIRPGSGMPGDALHGSIALLRCSA